jgi:hypothetical protein
MRALTRTPSAAHTTSWYCQFRVDGASFGRKGGGRFGRKPPFTFQWLVNLERKIMGKEFSEQAVIDGSLSDLLVAYELTLEIARHSSGENVKRAKAAAALLDVCFQNFSHFGTKSAVGLLEGQMEKLRSLPVTPSAETPGN